MQTADLLTRARSGEPAAVDALLRQHYDIVHAVCHRMVHNSDSANDAVQNALISVVKGLPRFDGRSAFSTWVYRIATNSAIDEIRRTQRQPTPVSDGTLAAHAGTFDPTAGLADQMDQDSALAAALALIPEEFRTALVLRYVVDLDYAEIAEVLEVPVGTVRSRLSRGRHLMADLLGSRSSLHDDPSMTNPSMTDIPQPGEPILDSTTSDQTPSRSNNHD